MILAISLAIMFLLLVFFGETEWAPHLLGIMTIIGLSLWSKANWQKFTSMQSRRLLWPVLLANLLLMFAYLLNLFTSINLSFSLERVAALLLSQLFFFLVIFQDFKQSWWKDFFMILKIMIIVLSLFVLVSGFLPQLKHVFPGMNMLYSNYGHNHFAGFLLLIIPIYIFTYFQDRHFLTAVSLALFYILIILSFARIVLLLSIFELLVCVWLIYRHRINLNALEKKFLLIFSLVLISFLFLQVFFSLTTNFSEQFICRHSFVFRNFCKNLWQDPRPDYWQRFWHIFKKNWLFGSGLDAANLVYPLGWKANQAISAYAHNEYLQLLAEMGIVGGGVYIVAWFLMLSTIWQSGKINNKKALFANFILLALGAISLNVVFDFDWQFHAIYLSSWMVGGYYLSKKTNLSSLTQAKQQIHTNKLWLLLVGLIRYLGYLFLILILIFILAFESSLYLRSQNKYSWSIIVFPFHKKLDLYFARYQEISARNWETLDQINHANFQYLFKKYGVDEELVNKEQLLINMFRIAGKPLLKDKLLDGFVSLFASEKIDQKVKEDLLDFLLRNWQLEESNSESNNFPRGYFERNEAIKLSGIFADMAKKEFLSNDWLKSLEFFQQASVIDAYVLFTHDQALVRDIFLKKFLVEDRELNHEQWQVIVASINSLHLNESWTVIFIDPEMAQIYQRLADLAVSREDWLVAEKYLTKLATYKKPLISGDNSAIHYWAKPQLATYYIFRQKWDLAKLALDDCLAEYPEHYECMDLQRRLTVGESLSVNKNRYFEISSIILGKKQWQDFFSL